MSTRYTLAPLLALALPACGGGAPEPNALREACYLKAKVDFHAAAEQCADEPCIDALGVELAERKAACP